MIEAAEAHGGVSGAQHIAAVPLAAVGIIILPPGGEDTGGGRIAGGDILRPALYAAHAEAEAARAVGAGVAEHHGQLPGPLHGDLLQLCVELERPQRAGGIRRFRGIVRIPVPGVRPGAEAVDHIQLLPGVAVAEHPGDLRIRGGIRRHHAAGEGGEKDQDQGQRCQPFCRSLHVHRSFCLGFLLFPDPLYTTGRKMGTLFAIFPEKTGSLWGSGPDRSGPGAAKPLRARRIMLFSAAAVRRPSPPRRCPGSQPYRRSPSRRPGRCTCPPSRGYR